MTATAESVDRTLRLPDGRRMGYAEFGDPTGRAVLFCHGSPGSRLQAGWLDQPARALGIRLISPDRPGMGLSTFEPGRELLGYPRDIETLAVGLDLPSFPVLGYSGGAPYAAVLAHRLPRVTALGLIAPLPPLSLPGVREGLAAPQRRLYALARYFPWAANRAIRDLAKMVRTEPEAARRAFQRDLPAADAEWFDRPDFWNLLVRDLREAFHSGTEGPAWETRLAARGWGFDLRRIATPVYIWHGDADVNVPLAVVRRLIDALPTCRAMISPGQGHRSIMQARGRDALAAMGHYA